MDPNISRESRRIMVENPDAPLKYFAIVRKSGESLVSLKYDKSVNEEMIGSFMSAIFTLGNYSINEPMANLSFEGTNLRMSSFSVDDNSKRGVLVIGIYTSALSEREFTKLANIVLHDFYSRFPFITTTDIVDVNAFDEYKNTMLDLVHQTIPSLQQENPNFDKKLDEAFKKLLEGDLSGLEGI